MNIHLTLGPKYSVDTNDIQGILDNADNIRIHWKAYPGGMHVYTDITKDTLIEWYEQYAGGTIHGDFEGLLSEFNKVLKTIGITPVSSSTRKTMSYLEEAFNMADNEWNAGHSGLFESSNFPEIYSYRGTNDKNLKLSYTAMQAWLMAMCLSELVPSSDPTSNNQTKLYQRAYDLGGGRKVALYDNYSLKGDVMIARLVAGVVYARNRSYYTFSDMDSMRSEIGGSSITLSDWTDMGYRSVSSIGYNVAANSIFPSAPGPFVTEYSSKTHPSEQPSSQFYGSSGNPDNWYDDNYKIDVAIDNEVTSKYNLAAKDDYLERTVQAVADDSESTRHQLAEKVYYQYSTGGTTTVSGKNVPNPRFTFKAATSSATGNAGYFTGTFNSEVTGIDLSDKITDSSGNDTVLKKFMDGVRNVGSKGRQQLFDAQMGRRRPSTGLNVSSSRILQKDDTSNEYRKNWLDDTSIARLVGSGTRYDSQGGAHSWYVDRNGNGKWDDTQGTTPYEPYVNDPWTFSGDNLYPGPGTYTYPSGHSAGVFSQALMLIQMLPDRADKILKAAYAYSVNRTIVRAHWNSDTIYGRVVGTMMVPVLNAVKSFQSIYKDAYSVVTGGGGGGTDDEILARVYQACYEAQGGVLPDASTRVNHLPTTDNPGFIIFKLVNNSESCRYLWNGRFELFTEDGTNYTANYREPSNFENGAHYYYWDETNFVMELSTVHTIFVPIKRTYRGKTQEIDLSKRLKMDDNYSGYVIYHSNYSSDEGDYLLHNSEQVPCIKSSSLRTFPSITDYENKTNEITGSDKNRIVINRVYEVSLTGKTNYVFPIGEDKSAYRAYLAHDSGSEHILDPLRLVEWKDYDPPTPPTPTDFSELLSNFNTLLNKKVTEGSVTYNYLLNNYNTAEDEWNNNTLGLFNTLNSSEVYNYRGNVNTYSDTAHTAMHAWLIAMCLTELVPTSGTSSKQTQLFRKAYELGEGSNVPIYGDFTVRSDVTAARLVAGAIYAYNHDNYASQIPSMRTELGGTMIPSSVGSNLGFVDEIVTNSQGVRIGYNISSYGYMVNTGSFLPNAPGPRIPEAMGYSLPYPSAGSFDTNKNYVEDALIDDFMVREYNLGAQTSEATWRGYSHDKKQRIVQTMATPPCTKVYMFGAEKPVKYTGTVDQPCVNPITGSSIYDRGYPTSVGTSFKRHTFGYGADSDNLSIKGPFSMHPDLYHFVQIPDSYMTSYERAKAYVDTQRTAAEKFVDTVTDIADNCRYPTYDPNFGRRRPGAASNLTGNPARVAIPGHQKNQLYNIDIAYMVADDTWGQRKLKDANGNILADGLAADAPTSYPSGHSAQIWALAMLLTQANKSNMLIYVKNAYEYSINRSIGRFHWNSDVMYGRLFGTIALPLINAMERMQSGYSAFKATVGR